MRNFALRTFAKKSYITSTTHLHTVLLNFSPKNMHTQKKHARAVLYGECTFMLRVDIDKLAMNITLHVCRLSSYRELVLLDAAGLIIYCIFRIHRCFFCEFFLRAREHVPFAGAVRLCITVRPVGFNFQRSPAHLATVHDAPFLCVSLWLSMAP